jgi:hypothetical protein
MGITFLPRFDDCAPAFLVESSLDDFGILPELKEKAPAAGQPRLHL